MIKSTSVFSLLVFILLNSFVGYSQDKNEIKIGSRLKASLSGLKPQQLIDILLSATDTAFFNDQKNLFHLINKYKSSAHIRLTVSELLELLKDNHVLYAEEYVSPKEELTTGSMDMSVNGINAVWNFYPWLNGTAVNIALKEQNFDTSDIDIKNRHFNSGFAPASFSTHASIMATIIAGAGNSSEQAKGPAWGSNLTSFDFSNLLPEPDSIFNKYNISVQNHSYGTDLNDYYGPDAAAYDQSAINNPALLNIFSSGNSGNQIATGNRYQGISGFANLTGSFKMAKNSIAVGATDSFGMVSPLSSRGPSYDGRIKPDLVAFGEDGTSGAAAIVSGSAALLHQAYKSNHHDSLPSSALIRAVLINSATLNQNEFINYVSGFGRLNTLKAVRTILNDSYFQNTIAKNDSVIYHITVPSSIARLKITLAWNDAPAIPNSAKALINDLDLSVSQNNSTWLPWVLSIFPNADSLSLYPVRKTDTLNTVEQVSIDAPLPGDYIIKIYGKRIRTINQQAFAIAFQMDTLKQLLFTYPAKNDHLLAGNSIILKWQTTDTGRLLLEYSINQSQWLPVQDVRAEQLFFKWNIPDTISTVQFRFNGGNTFYYSDTAQISKPVNLKVGFDCTDSFLLHWNKLPATSYQSYYLRDKYLQLFKNVTDTELLLKRNEAPSEFFAIAPFYNDKAGTRSFTINYTLQNAGCYINNFFVSLNNNSQALLQLQLGSLYHVASISFQKIINDKYVTLRNLQANDSLEYISLDTHLTRGINRYRVTITLQSGQITYSMIESVYYYPDVPVLIYPNPVARNSSLTLAVKDQGIYQATIFDITGRIMQSYQLNDLINTVTITNISKGMYLIKITKDGNVVFTQKIVVY